MQKNHRDRGNTLPEGTDPLSTEVYVKESHGNNAVIQFQENDMRSLYNQK